MGHWLNPEADLKKESFLSLQGYHRKVTLHTLHTSLAG